MRQPRKKVSNKKTNSVSKKSGSSKPKRVVKKKINKINEFGVSKLEKYFVEKYLLPYNIQFIYQFKSDIGRYYDFAVVTDCINPIMKVTCDVEHIEYVQGMNIDLLIEVDGDYYHSNPEKYKEENLNKLQLRNKRIDEEKNEWAMLNSIPILRLWESDIKGNRKKVIGELKKYLKLEKKKK